MNQTNSERLQELTTWKIAESLLNVDNLQEALSGMLNIVVETLDSEAGAIWLLDEKTNSIHSVINTGPVDLSNISSENGIGTEGQVITSEQSVLVSDADQSDTYDGCQFDDQGIRTKSLICVPLHVSNKTIGCMCIVNQKNGKCYTEDDLKLCEHSASLAAMVIDEKGLTVTIPEEKEILLELQGITKEYPSGDEVMRVLNGINLKVYKDEFVVVLGESGCGKSTMMNIIGGMDHATSGSLFLEGKDFSNPDEKALTEFRRNYVGFIFQSYNLMPNLTARENIKFIAEICPDPLDVDEALKQVGLSDRANNYPSQLSGGQQQRVSIARAIVKNPRIILADEPTAALDFQTGQEVLRVIENVVRGGSTTVLMVTHNVEIAKMADRVVKLRHGRVSSIKYNSHPLHADDLVW